MLLDPLFKDRNHAGIELAKSIQVEINQLKTTYPNAHLIVYALPRGGIPVAKPVANLLKCPLHIIVSKKITFPENPELALGAVTSDGNIIWCEEDVFFHKTMNEQKAALDLAQAKAQSQSAIFAHYGAKVNIQGAIAIIIDDGIATGMTMAAAALSIRSQQPVYILICAPVAPKSLIPWLGQWADQLIILHSPERFFNVGRFYANFSQVETAQALAQLAADHSE
ncbi:MAG TPA: phosphoribosyltransferase family protein [Allocoleopsis sp.]